MTDKEKTKLKRLPEKNKKQYAEYMSLIDDDPVLSAIRELGGTIIFVQEQNF